jgi:hypothetical protein
MPLSPTPASRRVDLVLHSALGDIPPAEFDTLYYVSSKPLRQHDSNQTVSTGPRATKCTRVPRKARRVSQVFPGLLVKKWSALARNLPTT